MVRFYISAMLYYEVASYVTKSVNVQSKLLLLNCYVQLHVCTTVYAKQFSSSIIQYWSNIIAM